MSEIRRRDVYEMGAREEEENGGQERGRKGMVDSARCDNGPEIASTSFGIEFNFAAHNRELH